MKKLFILLSVLIMSALTVFSEQNIKAEELWSSAKELKVPESVIFDEENQILYVANINGKMDEKDGNGFISKLSLEGEILELEFITGLNAPKGMGIFNGFLYVTDINDVKKIDLKKKKIVKTFAVENAKFLNDITICKKGIVYISDMMDNSIYYIKGNKINLFLKSDKLSNVNGLYLDDNGDLLAGINGKILSINTKNKKLSTFIDNTGSIDGLEKYDKDNFIISDWSGKVQLVSKKSIMVLFDTTEAKINAADIEVIPSKKMLLVPTFFDNRVIAYIVQ